MVKREEVLKNNFALGFHVTQRFDKVLAIDSCHLLSEAGNEILSFTRGFTEKNSLKPYDLRLHEGFWRYLIIREGKNTGERMVNIVTSRFEEKAIYHYGSQLVEKFPELTSIVNNVTSNRGGTAFGEQEYLLFGKDRIQEKLNRFQFEISANSFFQTNSHQAENLYAKVVEYADLKGEEIVFDLYSGTGAIAIFLSSAAKEIVGFEMIEAAVKNAVRNCEINQITNCKFVNQDLRTFFQRTEADPIRPDVIITDPPRDGMHKEIIKSIMILAPATIVYVSCNPTTLARDLALLQEKYIVEQIQPIDMFPHTFHIETVTKLKLKK
jgi:23S rRNA (uracil1939-C5)-methyltransferase